MSTIVTAYYQIPTGKHTPEEYLKWISNFLINVKGNIIFYTTEKLSLIFKNIRTENIIYEVVPFEELVAIKKYGYDFWQKQKDIDVESYHSPETGIVWYEKKEFVLRAIEKNYFNSDIFIWCDAGCVRYESIFSKIKTFGQNLNILNKDKLNVQTITDIVDKKFYQHPDIYMAAAIIAGNKEIWKITSKIYDEILLDYTNNKVCAIMEQYIYASLIKRYPEYFECIKPRKQYHDVWFFLLEELSN